MRIGGGGGTDEKLTIRNRQEKGIENWNKKLASQEIDQPIPTTSPALSAPDPSTVQVEMTRSGEQRPTVASSSVAVGPETIPVIEHESIIAQLRQELEQAKKEGEKVKQEMEQAKQEGEKWKEKQREWDIFKSKKNHFVSKWQQKSKEKEKQEVLEVEVWNLKKSLASAISTLPQLQIKEKLGHGCDGIVFLCSAKGIGDVALKLIFNMGIETNQVLEHIFNNEFELLKSIPFHKNIIPFLCEFKDRPSDLFFNYFPPDMKKIVSHLDGTRRMTQCILMPSLICFENYLTQHFRSTSIGQKLEFIADIVDGLLFLFENDQTCRLVDLKSLQSLIQFWDSIKLQLIGLLRK